VHLLNVNGQTPRRVQFPGAVSALVMFGLLVLHENCNRGSVHRCMDADSSHTLLIFKLAFAIPTPRQNQLGVADMFSIENNAEAREHSRALSFSSPSLVVEELFGTVGNCRKCGNSVRV
jgi:hypothetical protein